jgi:hypothetical protein
MVFINETRQLSVDHWSKPISVGCECYMNGCGGKPAPHCTLILSAYSWILPNWQHGGAGKGGGGIGIHESRNMHESILTNVKNDALRKQEIHYMAKRMPTDSRDLESESQYLYRLHSVPHTVLQFVLILKRLGRCISPINIRMVVVALRKQIFLYCTVRCK